MELLFAVLGGIICGGIAQVITPRRTSRGSLLAPAVGGIVAAVLWEALTWAGWGYGATWIWVVSLVGAGIVAVAVAWVVSTRRASSDDRFFAETTRNA